MAQDLAAEVEQLKSQVARLTRVVASTGQQVMAMQMQQRKQDVVDLDVRTRELQNLVPASRPGGAAAPTAPAAAGPASSAGSVPDDAGYVSENDLNEMVVELQGQLALLDERSIRRILNSKSSQRLVALPNADGEEHPRFPKSISAVQALSDEELFEHWNFYEMLPEGESLEDLLLPADSAEAKEANARVLQDIYVSFVKYIGLDPAEFPRAPRV